jgi:phage baseplate assembly protein V
MTFTRQFFSAGRRGARSARQAFRAVLTRLDARRAIPPAQATGVSGETLACELIQHYGIASAPPEGAEVVILPLGGSSTHGIIVASVHGEHRIELKPGEVALHTAEGDFLHFKQGRVVELVTETFRVKASKEVLLDTPALKCTGDIADKARSMAADREIYNGHDHIVPNAGKSEPPGAQQ